MPKLEALLVAVSLKPGSRGLKGLNLLTIAF